MTDNPEVTYDALGKYAVSMTADDSGKTTITLTKLEPYKYTIKTADSHHFDFEPATPEQTKNNWYLLSTLTKADGSQYYYAKKVSMTGLGPGQSVIDSGEIEAYYNKSGRSGLSEISINDPEGTSDKKSAFQQGDTVENVLVHMPNEVQKYGNLISDADREVYEAGSVIGRYTVTDNNPDASGEGTITLNRIPDLRVVTEFKDEQEQTLPKAGLPGDYYLLIKMTDADGDNYYALHKVQTNENPSNQSGHISFRRLASGALSNDLYYYTGSETMTTQLLIGNGLQLTAALASGSDGNATYYNVNTVDGAGRQDLSRDLFTSESSTAEGSQADPGTGLKPTVLTTSFIKSSDTGVDISTDEYADGGAVYVKPM